MFKKFSKSLGVMAMALMMLVGIPGQSFADTGDFDGKVDIGGYSLYMHAEGKGKPTVVLEAGFGEYSEAWHKVVPEIAQYAQVVTYDRSALGQSDVSQKGRTSKYIAEELHTLLHNANIKPPYILAGHSFGSLNIRMFQAMYPNEVAGLVLVDGTPENVVDLMNKYIKPGYEDLMRNGMTNPDIGTWDDVVNSAKEVYAVRESIKNIPVTVLVAPARVSEISDEDSKADAEWYYEDVFEPAWLASQTEIASLSSDSKVIVAEGSGMSIHREKPEYVISAILDMIEKTNKK